MNIKDLPKMQHDVILYIKNYIEDNGFSPTIRDIGHALGLSASDTVHGHLVRLEKKGLIERSSGKARSIRIIDTANAIKKQTLAIPLVIEVSSNKNMYTEENVLTYLPMPKSLIQGENYFALQIKSQSIICAGINAGDTLFVSIQDYATDGDIVVALQDSQTIIGMYYLEDSNIHIKQNNDNSNPIIVSKEAITILGKVTALIRRIR